MVGGNCGCLVKGCFNTRTKTKGTGVKYFSFPRENPYRDLWINVCRRGRGPFGSISTKSGKICSVHFQPHDFLDNKLPQFFGNRGPKCLRRLHKNAVPSLLLAIDKPTTEDSKRRTKKARRCDRNETVDQFVKEEVIIADSIYDSSCIYENGVGDFDEDSMGKASPIFHMAPDTVRANAAKKARSSNGTSNQRRKKRPAQDPIDEFDVFGKSVAAQLRKLSVTRALRAQTQIQTMLTEERLHDLETTSPPLKPITGDIETSGNGGGGLLVPEPTSISGGLLVQTPPSIDIGGGLLVHQPTSLGGLLVKEPTSTSPDNSIFDKKSNFGEANTNFDDLKPNHATEIHFKPECDVITLDEDDPFEGINK